jgi:hypothetical protein
MPCLPGSPSDLPFPSPFPPSFLRSKKPPSRSVLRFDTPVNHHHLPVAIPRAPTPAFFFLLSLETILSRPPPSTYYCSRVPRLTRVYDPSESTSAPTAKHQQTRGTGTGTRQQTCGPSQAWPCCSVALPCLLNLLFPLCNCQSSLVVVVLQPRPRFLTAAAIHRLTQPRSPPAILE